MLQNYVRVTCCHTPLHPPPPSITTSTQPSAWQEGGRLFSSLRRLTSLRKKRQKGTSVGRAGGPGTGARSNHGDLVAPGADARCHGEADALKRQEKRGGGAGVVGGGTSLQPGSCSRSRETSGRGVAKFASWSSGWKCSERCVWRCGRRRRFRRWSLRSLSRSCRRPWGSYLWTSGSCCPPAGSCGDLLGELGL